MKEIQLHRVDLNLLVVFETLMTERSVAGAAGKLGKTPSAVSHALARLREQLGDPLMVRAGGRMRPSPFALTLIDDVRPILRSIKRVLVLPEPFEPATSTRVFRVACPVSARLLSRVMRRVQSEAPRVKLEWLSAPRAVFDAVAEGLVDLAHLGGETRLPEGLDAVELPPFQWTSFVRAGHPAGENWGPAAWSAYPHVQVVIANDARSPFDDARRQDGPDRRVGALISEFSGVGPLLARTDMIGTFPRIQMAWEMETHGLRPLPPQIPLEPMRTRLFFSARLATDPAVQWIRDIVVAVYREVHDEADRRVEAALAPG